MTHIAENVFGRYCIPRSSSHTITAGQVLTGGIHEPDTIERIVDHARDRGAIVHAGAYFGDFLPALAIAGQTVWAFEPGMENWLHALGTIELNHLRDVRLVRAGLGVACARVQLTTRFSKDVPGSARRGGQSFISDDGDEAVELVALDETIPFDTHVAVIHLDVERYEGPALLGASAIIERCQPLVILETVPDDVAELLPGYTQTGTVHHNAVFEPAKES